MASCPRCGGVLELYEMWGREQASCGDCGYVGVPVDHVSDRDAPESWGDAIRRFQDAGDPPGPTERRSGPTTVPETPEDAEASPTVEVVSGRSAPPGGVTGEGDGDDEGGADAAGGAARSDGDAGDGSAADGEVEEVEDPAEDGGTEDGEEPAGDSRAEDDEDPVAETDPDGRAADPDDPSSEGGSTESDVESTPARSDGSDRRSALRRRKKRRDR